MKNGKDRFTVMCNGSDLNELMDVLKEMDSITNIDSVIVPRQQVCVTGQRVNGKFYWQFGLNTDSFQNAKPSKGHDTESFLRAMHERDKENYMSFSEVLCYCNTETTRTWDGKIKTSWFVIDPMLPYEIEDGQPRFTKMNLDLDEDQYSLMLESKLAFYDPEKEDIYPIRKVAYSSVGKLMDCAASFKYMDETPLASALMLANKLQYARGVRVLYRDRGEHFKPVIGIMGTRYVRFPQEKFFRDVLDSLLREGKCFYADLMDKVSSLGIYQVENWSVSDESTSVQLKLFSGTADYDYLIEIETSDIPGTSMSVAAYALIGKAKILLKQNEVCHWESKKQGYCYALLDGIFDAFRVFEKRITDLEKLDQCVYDPDYTKSILDILGKKRASKVAIPSPDAGAYTGKELYRKIIDATIHALPVKQAGQLAKSYNDLLVRMLKDYKLSDNFYPVRHYTEPIKETEDWEVPDTTNAVQICMDL